MLHYFQNITTLLPDLRNGQVRKLTDTKDVSAESIVPIPDSSDERYLLCLCVHVQCTSVLEYWLLATLTVANLGGGMGGMHPPHQPEPNDFGRKISLNFGEDLFFLETTWFWAEKTLSFVNFWALWGFVLKIFIIPPTKIFWIRHCTLTLIKLATPF